MKNISIKLTPITSLLIYICLVIGLLWFTFRDGRASDGPLSFGYPFPVYFGGGMCLVPCGPNFIPLNFIYDLLIFLLPIVLGYFIVKKIRNQPS